MSGCANCGHAWLDHADGENCALCSCEWYEEESAVRHVYPVTDLVEHDTSGEADCVCGPRTEPIPRSDCSMGWVVVHHSLDGCELREADQLA